MKKLDRWRFLYKKYRIIASLFLDMHRRTFNFRNTDIMTEKEYGCIKENVNQCINCIENVISILEDVETNNHGQF